MKVLIDNGHGIDTPGKRSPDGSLREYAYTREIADRLEAQLQGNGIDSVRIVPEETDIPLSERVALNLDNVHIYENNIDSPRSLLAGEETVRFNQNV